MALPLSRRGIGPLMERERRRVLGHLLDREKRRGLVSFVKMGGRRIGGPHLDMVGMRGLDPLVELWRSGGFTIFLVLERRRSLGSNTEQERMRLNTFGRSGREGAKKGGGHRSESE